MPKETWQPFGWTAVPRDPDVLLQDHPTASGASPKRDPALTFEAVPFPTSPLIEKTHEFAKETLSEPTFNHSSRVYIYGTALVKTHFPQWVRDKSFDEETYYLSCLLHDIGTAKPYLSTTKMSFEFKGAIVAREFLLKNGAPVDQADAVCEAIVRHQDIFVKGGNITLNGQVLQLATIIDNVGLRANLLHENLYQTTVAAFQRHKWSDCFASVIHEEENLKPWCHTTTFEHPGWKQGDGSNFARDVLANEVTGSKYESD